MQISISVLLAHSETKRDREKNANIWHQKRTMLLQFLWYTLLLAIFNECRLNKVTHQQQQQQIRTADEFSRLFRAYVRVSFSFRPLFSVHYSLYYRI